MTQIGGGAQNPLGQGEAGFARERAFAEGRAADARSGAALEAKQKPGARTAASDAMQDRQVAFQRSMRRASETDCGEVPATKLLASAEWSGSSLAMPMPSPDAAGSDPAARTTQTLVSAIAARIEQAFRAGLPALATSPTSVTIDLGGMASGLQQLSVTMTSTTLDVTFAYDAATLPEELVQATQALADRLARRFAGRTVRILQAAASEAAPESRGEGGLRMIGGLLSRTADTP